MAFLSVCLNDDSLGPIVRGCRGDFDFTIRFEKIFLSIVPAGVFLVLSLVRLAILIHRPRIVRDVAFGLTKISVLVIFAALQLFLLIVLSRYHDDPLRGLSIAATTSTLVSGLAMIALSWAEHTANPRPSLTLEGYLILTLIFDIIQARTLWLTAAGPGWCASLFTASVATKGLSLAVEARHKTKWLAWDTREHSPEESCGIFGLALYSWLCRLFFTGSRTLLSIDNLYPLDKGLTAEAVKHLELTSCWEQRSRLTPGSGLRLAWVIAKCLLVPFLLPVAPRIALIGFSFAQPFFIRALLKYLQQPGDASTAGVGHGLIGAGALIYFGIALSSALYSYYQLRAISMLRSCLGAAVYKKTTEAAPTTELEGGTATASVTLMSTDVERVGRGLLNLHEFWSCTLELGLGLWLLQRQLGEAFLAGVVTLVACMVIMLWASRHGGAQQRLWLSRIQGRIKLTATVLANMKSMKMGGVVDYIMGSIQSVRVSELAAGRRWRAFLVLTASLAHLPSTLTPAAAFALAPGSVGMTKVFTALSYLVLLSSPLNRICQALPSLQSAFVCLGRIQHALAAKPRQELRNFVPGLESEPIFGAKQRDDESTEKRRNQLTRPQRNVAVSVVGGSFGWTAERMTLSNITATIPAGKITMITGPVASGKSTFCKALLGEVPIAYGDITLSSSCAAIGFCDQTPFLLNATLKENVVGYSQFNALRYNEVLEATKLNVDVELFPDGHNTRAGSNGSMFSGGQKQRVSLARALYLESDLLIIDDILNSLDARTAEAVFQGVFGHDGIVRTRGATAVLCTDSVNHLSLADHVIVFSANGTVVAEGSFQQIKESHWPNEEDGRPRSGRPYSRSTGRRQNASQARISRPQAPRPQELEACLSKARELGDFKVYRYYFGQTSIVSVLLLLLASLLFGSMANFSTIWLGYWSEDLLNQDRAFYVGVYALLQGLELTSFAGGAAVVLIVIVARVGAKLHKVALSTVVMAPLRFYTNTDLGSVLNLFSQDMTIIDGELPLSLINVCLSGFEAIGMAVVITLASPYVAIGYPALLATLYGVQKLYLRTSKQLRFLDLEAKSPLYSHFLDTIAGLPTIRASGKIKDHISHNNRLLNASQRPAYLLSIVQQWLALTLRIIVAVVATITVALATQLTTSTAFAGASLVTLMSFSGTITQMIESYTQLEVSIGAISRLKTFSDKVASEALPGEDIIPSEDWPQAGSIEINNTSASYPGADNDESRSARLALKNLTLSIQPGEKIALCGRTGSGKSSIILLLLALLDPVVHSSQNITIDGLPLHRVNRAALRRRIIAVPQDPVFLPPGNTIKTNLDPYDVASDDDCVAVLEVVRLGSLTHGGFERPNNRLREGWSADSLSAGEQRLFALAKAILRHRVRIRGSVGERGPRGGLLLLDEINFAADKETERMIGDVIKQEFAEYTVILVSHQLELVVDLCRRVVVLENGMIVETGDPHQLIGKIGSHFGELWKAQESRPLESGK
ncbi:ABC transporter [Xylaria palmicola]|nr:ABC transporter [Xylaria palmicola]